MVIIFLVSTVKSAFGFSVLQMPQCYTNSPGNNNNNNNNSPQHTLGKRHLIVMILLQGSFETINKKETSNKALSISLHYK